MVSRVDARPAIGITTNAPTGSPSSTRPRSPSLRASAAFNSGRRGNQEANATASMKKIVKAASTRRSNMNRSVMGPSVSGSAIAGLRAMGASTTSC